MIRYITPDNFHRKFDRDFKAEYDDQNPSEIHYVELDKDGNETFSIDCSNISNCTTEEELAIFNKYDKNCTNRYNLCTTYGLQGILNMSFRDTYMMQAEHGVKWGLLFNFISICFEILKELGYTQVGEVDTKESLYTPEDDIREFLSAHKKGKYFLFMYNKDPKKGTSHAVGIDNGKVFCHVFEKMNNDEPHRCAKKVTVSVLNLLEKYYIRSYMYKLEDEA